MPRPHAPWRESALTALSVVVPTPRTSLRMVTIAVTPVTPGAVRASLAPVASSLVTSSAIPTLTTGTTITTRSPLAIPTLTTGTVLTTLSLLAIPTLTTGTVLTTLSLLAIPTLTTSTTRSPLAIPTLATGTTRTALSRLAISALAGPGRAVDAAPVAVVASSTALTALPRSSTALPVRAATVAASIASRTPIIPATTRAVGARPIAGPTSTVTITRVRGTRAIHPRSETADAFVGPAPPFARRTAGLRAGRARVVGPRPSVPPVPSRTLPRRRAPLRCRRAPLRSAAIGPSTL
ncbi:hypothetical protein GCM10028798_33830 [Humibacter antri]